jgi:hypothetical protein
MTENCIWPGGENSGKTLAVKRKAGVADREHTTMKAVQPTGSGRAMDGTTRITQRPGQLTERHNSMLPLCKLRQT